MMKLRGVLFIAATAICMLMPAADAQIPRDPTPIVSKTSPADVANGKLLFEAACSGNAKLFLEYGYARMYVFL